MAYIYFNVKETIKNQYILYTKKGKSQFGFAAGKGDAPQESQYLIFVTLSLRVECSLKGSHSTRSDRVTNIG